MRALRWSALPALAGVLGGLALVLAGPGDHRTADPEPEWDQGPAPAHDLRMTPGDRHRLQSLRAAGRRTAEAPATVTLDDGRVVYVVLNVEFKDAESCHRFAAEGAHVLTRFANFADVLVPARLDPHAADGAADEQIVSAIERSPGCVRVELNDPVSAPPFPPGEMLAEKPRALPEPIARGGVGGLTGKGVIVAVLDSGIDFHHPDFITTDAEGRPTSRLLYFWDTTSDAHDSAHQGGKAPVTYSNGASIGTIYTQEQLTAELRGSGPRITTWDSNGHGTACAGIAAGNGKASDGRYAGVAPEADLVAVRIGGGNGREIENAWLLGSICDWLEKVAGKRPLVVSCSWYAQRGAHDGSGIEERELDARFPADARGRAICFCAGNEGGTPLHAGLSFSKTKASLRWQTAVPPNDSASLSVFFDTADGEDLLFTGTAGTRRVRIDKSLVKASLHPLTGLVVWEVPLPSGPGTLSVATKSGKTVRADAYIGPYQLAAFEPGTATPGKQIGSPAVAAHAIAVGSYDWNEQFDQYGQLRTWRTQTRAGQAAPITVGALSFYSNPGPSRTGDVVKPDIVAPGQYFTASYSANTQPFDGRDSSGKYQLFNGTSAATPYTAGVIALLLQKKPDLTVGEIHELLKANATKDKFTGDLPNPDWGYGKLDLKAVQRMLDAAR